MSEPNVEPQVGLAGEMEMVAPGGLNMANWSMHCIVGVKYV